VNCSDTNPVLACLLPRRDDRDPVGRDENISTFALLGVVWRWQRDGNRLG
jgi:hypothetical protein